MRHTASLSRNSTHPARSPIMSAVMAIALIVALVAATLVGGCSVLKPGTPAPGSGNGGTQPGDSGSPGTGGGQPGGSDNQGGTGGQPADPGGDPGNPAGGGGGAPTGDGGGTPTGGGEPSDGAGSATTWIDATASPFAVRGVIEGFYGQPWSQSERLSALDFMGRVGLNTYVYAPKDDAYQRARWRALYPKDRLALFEALIAKATAGSVDFVYSISPGLDITYSMEADRQALAAKLDQLRGIGITTFMLSLDDVPQKLNQADAAVYGADYALAQAGLANWLYAEETRRSAGTAASSTKGSFSLWVTPTHYAGTKADDYLLTLGAKLDQAVGLTWTGPKVLSPTITVSAADAFGAAVRRKVMVWDNYPVNDYTYAIDYHPRLILGPLRGRAPDLAGHVAGYLLNPMIQEEASKLPLYTAAAYLADPRHYEPEAAWRDAAAHLVLGSAQAGAGTGAAKAAASVLLEFASYAQMSMVHEIEAPELDAAVAAYQPGSPASAAALRTYFQAMATMPDRLKSALPRAFYNEVAPWVEALRQKGLAGLAALDLDAATARGEKATVKAGLPGVQQQLTDLKAAEKSAYIAALIVDRFVQGAISRASALVG